MSSPSVSLLLSKVWAGGAGGGGGGGGGGASPDASITARSVSRKTTGTAVTVTYKLDNDGNVYNQNLALLEAWRDVGVSSDFEARATVTSGTISSGTTGTWQALSTDRSWSVTSAVAKSANVLIEIRDAVSHAVLTSATITLTVFEGTDGDPCPLC